MFKYLVAALSITILTGLAWSFGYSEAATVTMERSHVCNTKVFSEAEACTYFGYAASCRLKPRLKYTYGSHLYVACMEGRVGAAWNNH